MSGADAPDPEFAGASLGVRFAATEGEPGRHMTVTVVMLSALALFAAGTVKGLVGIGLPLVSLSLLSLFLPLADAVILMPVPIIVANTWQSFSKPYFVPALRRFWPLVLAMFVGTVVGAQVLTSLDAASLNLLVGALMVLFSLSSFMNPQMRLPARFERELGVVVGAAGGFMGGVSALFGPPIILYLASLRLDRESFVGVISSIYLCAAVGLVIVFGSVGVMSQAQFVESAIASVPLMLGVWAGQRYRGGIREAAFRKLLLVVVLGVGVRLIVIGVT